MVISLVPRPRFPTAAGRFITTTWKVGLGNKNDALVPSAPKHWDGCVYT